MPDKDHHIHSPDCGCRGYRPGDESIAYVDPQHLLVIIERNDQHRRLIKDALISMYNIIEFSDTTDIIPELKKLQPAMILIGENLWSCSGAELVFRIHRDPIVANTPTLLFLSSDHADKIAAAEHCGATAWLVQPYRRSALIKAISKQLNAKVEKEWEKLSPLQARALKGTVDIFNNLSDVIEKGEPIAYDQVRDACTPLVEVVNYGDFKHILSGVKSHDNYTYAHSLRVAIFLSLFGRTIGLNLEEQKLLTIGGLLHDVGKMVIPHMVLNKPGKLTPEEFDMMKEHVNASKRILEVGNEIPQGVIIIAAQHHEKIDGSGYPLGLKGNELNKLARMASIVDIFGALTDRRVYKPSMSPEKALAIMVDEMAGQLDMALLATFRQMLLDAAVENEL